MSYRTDQVVRVTTLLGDQLNTALHGAPQSGKSWVTDEVQKALAESGVPVIRLDFSLMKSGSEAFSAIAHELTGELSTELSVFDSWRHLRRLLADREDLLCIMLDEFDAVVRFDDSQDFLRLLRELIHRPAAVHCSCLIVSRRSLEAIESEVRGISTLASVCVHEHTRSMDPEDLRAAWPNARDLKPDELASCISWSAGHPPLVRYWISARPDVNPGDHCLHVQIDEFDRLVEHLDKARLIDAAAQLVLGPVVDDWFIQKSQLQRFGLVGAEGECGPLGENEVFRDCLRKRTLDLNPWGVLGAVEVALRGLIQERLSAVFGEGWQSTACRQHKALTGVAANAKLKQEADERKFGRSGPWLAYTYPGDLTDIVMRFWEHFNEVFDGGDKPYWRVRLVALASYRTPVAHNRVEVLGDDERLQCRMFAQQVLRSIDDYRQSGSSFRESDEPT